MLQPACEMDGDDPVVVTIGRLGAGKSLLANRMLGKTDDDPNSFKVSSETERLQPPDPEVKYGAWMDKKENGYLWVVDAPGHDDVRGNDEENREKVLGELKKLKAAHAFILVKKADERIGGSDKKTLSILAEKFGRSEFIKRLIVVLSL